MDRSTITLLKHIPLFSGLDEHLLAALAGHVRRRKFHAGVALFHQGDPGQTLYLIAEGSVNIQTSTNEGQPVHLAQRVRGEHFGEMALIDGKPRMADAVTAEACELIMLDRTEFVRCIEASPKIALGVMASLADRLREAAGSLEGRQGLDVLGRLSELLLQLLDARSSEAPEGGRLIDTPLTQQAIADRIGTTRETVNRCLASLKDSGAIRMSGRKIVVLSAEKLRRHCER